jgi:hypothetical protein
VDGWGWNWRDFFERRVANGKLPVVLLAVDGAGDRLPFSPLEDLVDIHRRIAKLT